MTWGVPESISEAITFFMGKEIISKAEFELLSAAARQKAFTLADVARRNIMEMVMDSLSEALINRTPLNDWKAEIAGDLESEWGRSDSPRLNTIYRTNMNSSYAAGRHARVSDPDVSAVYPYWQFDAALDERTTKICKTCHGVILHHTHPWWNTHHAPMHFNCRSVIKPMTASEARQRGVTQSPPDIDPQEGFGARPSGDTAVEQQPVALSAMLDEWKEKDHASSEVEESMVDLADFDESDHPRGKGGKFAKSSGSGGVDKASEKHKTAKKDHARAKAQRKYFEDAHREAVKSGDPKKISEAEKNLRKSKQNESKAKKSRDEAKAKVDAEVVKHTGIKADSPSIPKATVAHVAHGVIKADLGNFIKKHPPAEIKVVSELHSNIVDEHGKLTPKIGKDGQPVRTNGKYSNETHTVQVRHREDGFGKEFKPGKTHSISALAKTPEEAMQRTLVHEMHHHVHGIMREKNPKLFDETYQTYLEHKDHAITKYAQSSYGEYFAETMSAYHYERDRLKEHDPAGFAMAEKASRFISRQRLSILSMPHNPITLSLTPSQVEKYFRPADNDTSDPWSVIRPHLVRYVTAREAGELTRAKAHQIISDAEDALIEGQPKGNREWMEIGGDYLEIFGAEEPAKFAD